ncbi:hypothetical protein WKH21_06195 [Pantoea agglomerans]|uniref:hypothetical protein n=1 Tax=Enterobacter agglomerans TaxID=549 RepID=UPI003C7D32F0
MSDYPITAFPTTEAHWVNENVRTEGMTLRDYFAAKAMHGYISTAAAPCIVGGLDGAEDELAKGAYKMADAMLRARGQ